MAIWNKILGKPAPAAQPHKEVALQDSAPSSRAEEYGGRGAEALVAPHTTEKATDFSARGIYVFQVASGANKRAVARAVAARYGVMVTRVRMAVQPAKERRRGRQIGWKRGFKKAMVQLKEGQRIESL